MTSKASILKTNLVHSRLEGQGEPDLGAPLNGLGVNLRGDGDK
jgi:hypothetical protein